MFKKAEISKSGFKKA